MSESYYDMLLQTFCSVFKKAGIDVTPQNRQEIDRIIHEIVGVDYKKCPAAWRQVKTRVFEDGAGFVSTWK